MTIIDYYLARSVAIQNWIMLEIQTILQKLLQTTNVVSNY